MRRPSNTLLHEAYPLEIWRDTVVITPVGDAVGFSATTMNVELGRIREFVRSPEIRNLIVDLSRGNYFGSVVIGELVQLGHVIRERGGRTALTGLSSDMRDVLRVMKLEEMWEIFDTKEQALRKVANVSWLATIRTSGQLLVKGLGVIALAVLIYFIWPTPNYEERYLLELEGVWDQYEQMKSRNVVSEKEWEAFLTESRKKYEPIAKHLKRYANADRVAARHLLWVSKDFMRPALNNRGGPPGQSEVLLKQNLQMVRAMLELPPKTAPALKKFPEEELLKPQDEVTSDAAASAASD